MATTGACERSAIARAGVAADPLGERGDLGGRRILDPREEVGRREARERHALALEALGVALDHQPPFVDHHKHSDPRINPREKVDRP